jgi:hypothetical protein
MPHAQSYQSKISAEFRIRHGQAALDVISTGGTEFKFSAPKALFDARISGSQWDGFDVSADGRFLMPIPVQQGFSVPI